MPTWRTCIKCKYTQTLLPADCCAKCKESWPSINVRVPNVFRNDGTWSGNAQKEVDNLRRKRG